MDIQIVVTWLYLCFMEDSDEGRRDIFVLHFIPFHSIRTICKYTYYFYNNKKVKTRNLCLGKLNIP